jgi:hypothetical protein
MQRTNAVAGRLGNRRGSSRWSDLARSVAKAREVLLVPVVAIHFLTGPALAESAFPPMNAGERGAGDQLSFAGDRQDPGFIDERGVETPGPSRRQTILLSALVPGLGQLLRGERTYGTLFLVGEVTSWTSFAVFRWQGNQREDRYIEFAERFAGVEDAGGQSDDYYGHLARYDRSGEPGGPDSYNEVEVRAYARDELYPGDRAAQEEYIRENSITGAQAWDWESEAHRREYASLRVGSETAYHRSEYSVGGLIAGRILSVMHAIWLTAEDEGEGEGEPSEQSYRLFLDTDHPLGESRLGVRYRF